MSVSSQFVCLCVMRCNVIYMMCVCMCVCTCINDMSYANSYTGTQIIPHASHAEPSYIKLDSFQNITTSNDSLTVFWNLLTFYSGDYNLSVRLSDGPTINVPLGTQSYTFKALTPDTCYNVSVAATSCSLASIVQCTSTRNALSIYMMHVKELTDAIYFSCKSPNCFVR